MNQRSIKSMMEGARLFLGVALLIDSLRCIGSPEAAILGLLVRWPSGAPLPSFAGAILGMGLLVRSMSSGAILLFFSGLALVNSIEYYSLLISGAIGSGFPIPISLVALGILFRAIFRPETKINPYLAGLSAAATGVALLIVHFWAFGWTDYRRPADAIVVFGAGIRDGQPSLAMEDRVLEGARLYHEGYAKTLVLSGGAEETEVMKRLAVGARVPETAIVLDPGGDNTELTLRNVTCKHILAVSHYYHLARIKHAASRLGIRCSTVPCRMTRRLTKEPFFVARECAAFVSYYFRSY